MAHGKKRNRPPFGIIAPDKRMELCCIFAVAAPPEAGGMSCVIVRLRTCDFSGTPGYNTSKNARDNGMRCGYKVIWRQDIPG
ncbi:hypothetical protein LU631_00340 [Erwinia tracheiphila]|uniref:Uncharacterized protein n=1 Tax=Erwinia tracheiphila TaxID=65700 RepID=A0A0M2KBD0_9GAMM|nr:hypothetical protein [Erwinia tracheiphila]AXF77678.1 hypothetical protein AV903_19145 [Erwinia tracheiphila]EOS92767.1 hypothetical protein ETR_22676 [Erwinia tracheiphila PSU-1]KKF36665.1 hypothetical protein SY86_16440 [Erwinia tracheiphila]UIA83635.1 hypothetical protein LU604_00215 [Erwinia tracheiphila]UIA88001.1 hypothetical protein LU631_00340 [Erwinia tracheiphila]